MSRGNFNSGPESLVSDTGSPLGRAKMSSPNVIYNFTQTCGTEGLYLCKPETAAFASNEKVRTSSLGDTSVTATYPLRRPTGERSCVCVPRLHTSICFLSRPGAHTFVVYTVSRFYPSGIVYSDVNDCAPVSTFIKRMVNQPVVVDNEADQVRLHQ